MKHVRINVRLICIAALTVLAVLPSVSCGERKAGRQAITTSTPQVTVEAGSKQPQQLSDVLVELEALTTPEGVDAALFQRLKDRLREKLVERYGEKGVCKAPDPLNERNRVNDLHWIGEEDGEVVNNRVKGMQWRYRNLGDYNQDGVVSIDDITPLAIHYGESVPDDDTIRELIDEDD